MNSIGAYLYLIRGDEFNFPYQECVRSILPFCDGVHVLTDPRFKDTETVVAKLERLSPKVFVHQEEVDLDDPGVDGKTKARVRELASEQSYEWLLQMDADEIFREKDIPKINALLEDTDNDLVSCGVINWFNGQHIKVSSPWTKERFSRNVPHVTHGIPVEHRIERDDGLFYVDENAPTDGAGYIDKGGDSIAGDVTTFNDLPKLIAHSKESKHYVNQAFYDSLKNDIWIHHYSWSAIPCRWRRETTWDYFWGILRGKYESLEDYEKADDGKFVSFWASTPMRNPKSYIQSIADEMKDKGVFHIDWIKHPKVMTAWLQDNEKYTYGQKKQQLCKPRFSIRGLWASEQVVFE